MRSCGACPASEASYTKNVKLKNRGFVKTVDWFFIVHRSAWFSMETAVATVTSPPYQRILALLHRCAAFRHPRGVFHDRRSHDGAAAGASSAAAGRQGRNRSTARPGANRTAPHTPHAAHTPHRTHTPHRHRHVSTLRCRRALGGRPRGPAQTRPTLARTRSTSDCPW